MRAIGAQLCYGFVQATDHLDADENSKLIEGEIFLKTIIPSRKAAKQYLGDKR